MKWADWETITVQGRDFAVMVEPDAAMRHYCEECELTRSRCDCEAGE